MTVGAAPTEGKRAWTAEEFMALFREGHRYEIVDGKPIENGSRLVWLVHPSEHYVLVYRSSQEPDRLLKSVDLLEGEEVIPGFALPVAHLFQKLSF